MKEELLESVVQHGKKVHGCQDTPDFRENIVKEFKKGPAPASHHRVLSVTTNP